MRVPTTLRWVLVGTATFVGAVVACGGDGSPADAPPPIDMAEPLPIVCCVPDGTDAGVCPEPPICNDILMPPTCPPGCKSVG